MPAAEGPQRRCSDLTSEDDSEATVSEKRLGGFGQARSGVLILHTSTDEAAWSWPGRGGQVGEWL
jgi:hypothetical protein